ncbi:amidohydrolase family protein [Sphaerisporangium sp. NPDC051017]|uniref:amidohydrolase family protein n=1 Tax=Sphaerisporangium sp. NPDC051017 TaxID=3154636 RepID=UPI00341E67D4
MSNDLEGEIGRIGLVDHHVHGALRERVGRCEFEGMITESDRPVPAWMTQMDSQIGFAIRRHCAPLLGLEASASADDYWAARAALEPEELARVFLRASGTDVWLVETGYKGERLLGPDGMAAAGGGEAGEVVRLESLLEEVASVGPSAVDLWDAFRTALRDRCAPTPPETAPGWVTADGQGDAARAGRGGAPSSPVASESSEVNIRVVGLKSVVAYRHGFDFDPAPPSEAEVTNAAWNWLREIAQGASPRVTDPVLLRMVLWTGVETGLPVQLHTGYGDPDIELHRCDPLLLTRWLKAVEHTGSTILLLHCYPFQRNAGYLAQVFPHVFFDAGLAINYTGARSDAVVAETLELAPFAKILYSSDAWGPPELHYLGALLWRRGMTRALSSWVGEGEWTAEDAVRVATMIGRTNAARVYGLTVR